MECAYYFDLCRLCLVLVLTAGFVPYPFAWSKKLESELARPVDKCKTGHVLGREYQGTRSHTCAARAHREHTWEKQLRVDLVDIRS